MGAEALRIYVRDLLKILTSPTRGIGRYCVMSIFGRCPYFHDQGDPEPRGFFSEVFLMA